MPVYLRIAEKANLLRELGMSDKAIARRLGVTDKTVAKALEAMRARAGSVLSTQPDR